VFEIGNSLQETRLRQGLNFAEAEQATKIRSKYLRALEDEQFDALPSQTYVKGFLRSYADFLGLDGQLYVDEYNSRFVTGDDDEMVVRPRRSSARPRRERRLERNAVLIALIGIGVVVALVIGAWKLGGNPNTGTNQIPNLQHGNKRTAPVHVVRPNVFRLVIRAIPKKTSSLQLRIGGPAGPVRFQGTVDPGMPLVFVAGRFWLNIGTPENLSIKLNGRSVPVGGGKPCVVIFTKNGPAPAGPNTC
jgi:hypothetical protein